MLPSMSIKHTVRWQNLVAHLVAKGTPLRHILLGWFKTLSGREKGQAGGLRGAEEEEEVNTATLPLFTSLFLSGAPAWWGLFRLDPSIFLSAFKVCHHPRSPQANNSPNPQPAVTLTYFLFALLAGLLPLTSPPAPFSIALVL